MNKKIVVSHKLIINHIQKNSLLLSTVEITNKLKKSVKASPRRYNWTVNYSKKTPHKMNVTAADKFKEWNQGCNEKETALAGSSWIFKLRIS